MARTMSYPPIAQLVERETVDGAVLTQPSLGPEFESQLGDFNKFFLSFQSTYVYKSAKSACARRPAKIRGQG